MIIGTAAMSIDNATAGRRPVMRPRITFGRRRIQWRNGTFLAR
jgi:hypothetical protein